MAEAIVSAGANRKSVAWRHAALAVVMAAAAVLIALHDTVQSLLDIWVKSDTYMHGFLVLPITLWLVWQKRSELRYMVPRPAPFVALLLVGNLLLWILAVLVGVQIVAQVALVAALVLVTWAILGHRIALFLAFPLFFLFFGIPMGEDLVPPLMEFTATFTVKMLQLTGIPVYREGFHFVIPSGSWSVVEACSGSRYLIASVTLGFLYAYLTYQSLWRRLLFILLSAVVPILANGLRAYIIVMLGHLSDMKLATGVDHLLYGWVFFGIVMMLMFWVGSWWSQPYQPLQEADVAAVPAAETPTAPQYYGYAALIGGLAVAAAMAPAWLEHRAEAAVASLTAPSGVAGWQGEPGLPTWGWEPRMLDTELRLLETYRRGNQEVAVAVSLYPVQRQDAEAVNSQNAVVAIGGEREAWGVVDQGAASVAAEGMPATVRRLALRQTGSAIGSDPRTLVTWQWYRLGRHMTASAYLGKLYTALNLLYPGRTDGAYFVIAAMQGPAGPPANQVLEDFAKDMGGALERAVETAVLGAGSP